MAENQKLLALLIDSDNISAPLIPAILNAVSKHGKPIIKQIYGDLSLEQRKVWEPIARQHNIDIAPHYNVSNGKNATDSALVIGAMDILHRSDKLGGFCIVSSDSDFTHLAKRIKEQGLFVIGIGKSSSQTLKKAYDHFISIESIQGQNTTPVLKKTLPKPAKPKSAIVTSEIDKFRAAYKYAADNLKLKDKDGWVELSVVKDVLKKLYADYEPHMYRGTKHSKLTKVVEIMIANYPNVIELNPTKKASQIRFKK